MAIFVLVFTALLLVVWLLAERGTLLRQSTKSFLAEQGWRNIFSPKTVHGYIYLRWTRQYIALAIRFLPRAGREQLKNWADRYHAKVLTEEQAKAIITLNRTIDLRDLEQVIPYPHARNLVLQGPPEVVVYECVCRAARKDPCRPTQVCMVIGRPFTEFILEHHPKTSRRLTRDEALALLREEHERGHVHTAWFKDVMLDRFYAICNCCSCCCGALQAKNQFSMTNVASSGYMARAEESLCRACGACERACPFLAITVDGTAAISREKCMGCGVCETRCPHGAISLVRDEKKGIPLDVRALQ